MPARTTQSRRRFLKQAASAASVMIGRPWWSPLAAAEGRRASPSEELRVGVVGCGVRGKYLIGNLPESARVVALCDCATSRLTDTLKPRGEFASVLARFREAEALGCATHQDYRRMLDREGLDAVIIATPDHHHAPAAVRALQAGLDVYLEKPLTLTVREGRRLADTVARTGCVLQVGSQQRTMEMNRFACEFIRGGGLGRVTRVDLPNYPGPIAEPGFPKEPIPEGFDWGLFCGPAPLRPHNRRLWVKDEFRVGKLLWRGWDLFRDYSGHLMTNWGAHSIDMVQLALGRDGTGPVEVRAVPPSSVTPTWEDWRDKTPAPTGPAERRFWPVTMRYADGVELRFVLGQDGVVFHGERGRLRMRRNEFETDPPGLAADPPDPALVEKWEGNGHVARPHLENWLECGRTRGVPNAPVEAGHRTATICHLANIARELNRPLRWDPEEERFGGDEEADALLERPQREAFRHPN